MIEIRLKYDGGGKFSAADHQAWQDASDECEDGETYVARLVRPRSSPENRLVHGAIKSAYDNQRGGPMFSEEDGGWRRLRAWLLCEAGWCDMQEFKPGSITPEVIAVLKQRDQAAFWTANKRTGVIRVRFPKSISYRSCKHPDFQPVKTKMLALLCEVICPGTTPEQLMEERYTRAVPHKATKRKAKATGDASVEA